MEGIVEVWGKVAPEVRAGVTGIGVWTALKTAVPVALDEDVFVLGVPSGSSELGGHLRMPQTARLIEQTMTKTFNKPIKLRVIDGTTEQDWELQKRRDAERRRMQEAEMQKMRVELVAKTSWDGIFEQISRRNAAMQNKSLPQNRARFYEEAIELVAEARKSMQTFDDLAERNFARCIERVSQYTDVPSTIVAMEVLKRVGEM